MLIRSQDKKRIFDMTGSNVEIGVNNEICGYGNTCTPDDISKVLGWYKTEGRSIEILDEICNAYLNLNIAKGGEFFGMNSSMGYFGGYVKNGIFQMPEV